MRYISNTAAQQREMLATIGASSIEDLLSRIPTKARLSHPLNVHAAMAEADLVRHLRRLSSKNANADDFACFLGAGSYDHTVPSPINHMISRGEFFTAYTPYQPEASQGTLRSIFEYQTMMAELTGMDVANASLYDGASSLAEAVLMAHAVTERNTTVLSKGINPLYRQVVETYVEGPGLRLRSAALADGVTDLDALRKVVNAQTAAVVIQYPNFFGCLEDVKAAGEIAHAAGALLAAPPVPGNLACPARPGAPGAALVWAEGRGPAGPMPFGGPNRESSPSSRSSYAGCPAALSAPPWTSTASAVSSSPCRRASSTSAARRRPRTSAPTWLSAPSWRRSTWPSWARSAYARWASSPRPKRTTRRRRSAGSPG